EQVTAYGSHIAELGGSPREQRLGEEGVLPADERVPGQVAVADEGADADPAAGERFHLVHRKGVDVDDPFGFLDGEFHEIDEVGAAADIAGGGAGCGSDG